MDRYLVTRRRNRLAYLIVICLMTAAGVFSYGVADYSNYELIYEYYTTQPGVGVVDEGFLILCRFFKHLGVSFTVFRGLYIFTALIIMIKGVSRYDENGNVPLLLYTVFPFLLDVVQFRAFMVSAIIVYSVRFLEEKRNAKFLLAVVIAASQHITAVFYLALLLINIEKKKLFKIVCAFSILELVILGAFSGSILGRVGQILTHYLEYSSSAYSTRLCLLYFIMHSVIVTYVYFAVKDRNSTDEFLTNILYVMFIFIPLIMMNENFTRLYRGLIVLVYCRLYRKASRELSVTLSCIAATVLCGILFYIHLSPHNLSHWERIVVPVFENNYLVEWLRK